MQHVEQGNVAVQRGKLGRVGMVQAHHALQSGASCSPLSGRDLAFVVIKSDVGQSMALRVQILSEQSDPAAKIEQWQLCAGNRRDRGGIDRIVG